MTIQREATTKEPRRGCGWLFFCIMIVFAAIWGALLGVFVWLFEASRDSVEGLETFRPAVGSKVYSSDGEVIAEFTKKQRQLVSLSEIPLHVQLAFVATEDDKFFEHKGVRPDAILNAVKYMVMTGRVRGASTITQQTARNIEATGITSEQSIERKAREALVALHLERNYTKDEILEWYLNQIFLGISAWGVEAASQQYYGKHVWDLTLSEGAVLAGLTRSPNSNNPLRHLENAVKRRNIVLDQMLENQFITQEEYDSAMAESVEDSVVTPEERLARLAEDTAGYTPDTFKAPYFVEEVRKFVSRPKPGVNISITEDELFSDGLTIQTTVDMRLQRAAEEVLLAALDKFDEDKLEYLKARNREHEFKPVTGALVCIDNRPGYEGYIRAMVGGRDFSKNKFNNATQALRQPGSNVKPFVWLAAIDNNMTASDIIVDEPFEMLAGSGDIWRPENFTGEFSGPVTLRNALARSINIVSVKLVQRLGFPRVRSYFRDVGIYSPIRDEAALTIGLGSQDVYVLELANAYATIARGGVYTDTTMVTAIHDRDGFSRYDFRPPKKERRIPEDATYVLTYLMEGVAEWGSGIRSRALERPRAGKTGTTNESRNVWFSGFTPDFTCVVWVGYSDNSSLGANRRQFTGGRIACPIWTDFMIKAHEGMPVKDFTPPYGVVFHDVDRATGLAGGSFKEAFIRGTRPPLEMPPYLLDDGEEIDSEPDMAPLPGSEPPDSFLPLLPL